jgi:hypothetical protein
MQLDDLGGLEEPGRLRGEPHHQHGPDREVGHDQHPNPLSLIRPRPHLSQPLIPESRGTHRHVEPMFHAPLEVPHDRVRMCEVHDNIGAEQGLERIPLIHLSDELKVGLSLDGGAHLLPHPPPGPNHPHLDHHASR